MELIVWLAFAILAFVIEIVAGRSKRRARKSEERELELLRERFGQSEREDEEAYDLAYGDMYAEERFDEPPYVAEAYTIPTYDEDVQDRVKSDAQVIRSLYSVEDQYDDIRYNEVIRNRAQRRKASEAPSTTPYAKQRTRRPRITLNPATARQGIIWMEVLGTPKGLR
jgi:hypothetical protein